MKLGPEKKTLCRAIMCSCACFFFFFCLSENALSCLFAVVKNMFLILLVLTSY